MLSLDRLDRYALRLVAGPLALALLALLMAQLLERLLRLFDLAAAAGAPPSSVLVMASMLVPHYLGLALPMAFTASICAFSFSLDVSQRMCSTLAKALVFRSPTLARNSSPDIMARSASFDTPQLLPKAICQLPSLFR